MSGHSKWASIKHKKAIVDSRRGAQFSKLARAIMVAARDGGGDPDANATLENAVRKAKEASMPKDNIERAIAKGTGEGGEADAIETVLYEGYGPGGVALLVEAMTENRNRTGADVRHAFSKHGGSLGEPGSVAYLFDKKGTIVIDADALLRRRADARRGGRRRGHLDRRRRLRGRHRAVGLHRRAHALEEAGVEMESAEMAYRPSSLVPIDEGQAGTLMRLIETLEENDDVDAVHANFDAPADVLERVAGRRRAGIRADRPSWILCGGRGTRLQEHTQEIPKPLVEIGGMPIVWHVIQLYAVQGFRRFLLATGYKGGADRALRRRARVAGRRERGVRRHRAFRRRRAGASSCSSRCSTARSASARPTPTGSPTSTCERAAGVPRRARRARDDDGRAPGAAVRRHRARWTAGRVRGFREKPRSEHWINGGFFCFQAGALDYLEHDSVLERAPLERLAAEGSCGPTATRASGSAWTPTRTPSR